MLAGSPRASRHCGRGTAPQPRTRQNALPPGWYSGMAALAPGFAFGGPGAQRALLEAEGVAFLPDGRVDMARHQWTGEDETL